MKSNFKYIIKDSLNTHISMVDNLEEVHKVLGKMSEKFEDNYTTLGGSLNGRPTYEDNALFSIPSSMRPNYGSHKYIKFYFFKFDIDTNEIVELY